MLLSLIADLSFMLIDQFLNRNALVATIEDSIDEAEAATWL